MVIKYNYLFQFAVEKVIFTICNRSPAPTGEEDKFVKNVERMLKAKRKGLVVWLEDGKLNVEPDVLIQLMLGAPIAAKNRRLLQETPKHMGEFPSQEVRYNPTSYGGECTDSCDVLVLKTRIRQGIISYATEDLVFRYPNFVIPKHIEESLRCKYSTTANGVLSIYSNTEGKLRTTVHIDRAATCLII